MSYRLLVLPDERRLSLPVLRKLRALVAAGATVVGPAPAGADTLAGQPRADAEAAAIARELWGAGRVADRTARQALEEMGVPPDVLCPGAAPGDYDTMHRSDGGAEIYFVANRRAAAARLDARFRVSGRAPELWDPVTGTRRFAAAYRAAGGVTAVPLELPPYGSVFVIFREPAAAHPPAAADNAVRWVRRGEVAGPWDVAFDPRWGGPAAARFPALVSWTERPESGIRYYAGKATYRASFTLGDAPRADLWLNLGLAREIAVVRLNGRPLGTLWAPPFRLALGSAARSGRNELEIDVVNFWANRIIGDASLPPERRLTRTNIATLKADSPLMPSGLLGPVVLESPAP